MESIKRLPSNLAKSTCWEYELEVTFLVWPISSSTEDKAVEFKFNFFTISTVYLLATIDFEFDG